MPRAETAGFQPSRQQALFPASFHLFHHFTTPHYASLRLVKQDFEDIARLQPVSSGHLGDKEHYGDQ